MPGIHMLTDGWLELESDPGLFTMLMEEFGVQGVQVEEVYDLHQDIEGPVYGFIFLFRWHEDRRSRRKIFENAAELFEKDDEKINSIFFAQQIVPNSCATHALLSVLLNCEEVQLGETLTRLKNHTRGMCSEDKGIAIGNTPELACAHNAHAGEHTKRRQEKSNGVSSGQRISGEAFHFVCFVPIDGHLFELDGLKPYPMNHGKLKEGHDWSYTFRCTMIERLAEDGEQSIRYNLMAIVPDRRIEITHKLGMLRTNRSIVTEALEQLKKNAPPSSNSSTKKDNGEEAEKEPSDVPNIDILQRLSLRGENETDEAASKEPILSPEMSQALPIPDLTSLLKSLENEIVYNEGLLRDENANRHKYQMDDVRRKHNYDEFICTFLTMLAHQRVLTKRVIPYLPASVRKSLAPRNNKAAANKKPAPKTAAGKRRRAKGRYARKK